MPNNDLTLIVGGARSGKSRYAEGLIKRQAPPWRYIATAEALDQEMRERIRLHAERRGDNWQVQEAPVALMEALDASPQLPVLVDCLTLWLSNLLLGGHDIAAGVDGLEAGLRRRRAATVLVANEVGFGIVPDNALARRFRDEAGWLNQRMAALADHVVLVVAGLPVTVKAS